MDEKTTAVEAVPASSSKIDAGSKQTSANKAGVTTWRVVSIMIALGLCVFLSQLETTVVSTSLVTIVTDIEGSESLDKLSWIVTSYLVTYTSFLAIIAKLSDIFGRKTMLLTSCTLFLAFSAGCGFAQTVNSLIILRAFQGIGGAGIFAMAYVILPNLIPVPKIPVFVAYLSLVAAIAALMGPLIGGAISQHTTWRWVFWLNLPVTLVAIVMIGIALPRNFPYHREERASIKRPSLKRIDIIGNLLLFSASVLLVTALEEASSTSYSWKSALPIACVSVSAVSWISFVLWAKYLDYHHSTTSTTQERAEPVFPWPLMTNRIIMGSLLNSLFSGGMFLGLAISLPQRFQIVTGDSPFQAGVKILPLTLSVPLGNILGGVLMSKAHVPPLYLFMIGGVIQTVGICLLSSMTFFNGIAPAVYGYQILSGVGIGISIVTCVTTIPLTVLRQYKAVAMGSIGQFRMLGGVIILSIFADILGSYNSSVASVEPESAADASLLDGRYQRQMQIMIIFSGLAILAGLLLVEKVPRRVM